MNYRRLEKGEIVHEGDEIDRCANPWHDDAVWEPGLRRNRRSAKPQCSQGRSDCCLPDQSARRVLDADLLLDRVVH